MYPLNSLLGGIAGQNDRYLVTHRYHLLSLWNGGWGVPQPELFVVSIRLIRMHHDWADRRTENRGRFLFLSFQYLRRSVSKLNLPIRLRVECKSFFFLFPFVELQSQDFSLHSEWQFHCLFIHFIRCAGGSSAFSAHTALKSPGIVNAVDKRDRFIEHWKVVLHISSPFRLSINQARSRLSRMTPSLTSALIL